jgi:deoxyribodipyrimidine photolyase-related protein
MRVFRKQRGRFSQAAEGRQWALVPYDQLPDRIGPLSRHDPNRLGIIMIESGWKAARRPDHKQKLALILANIRHLALEQAARGVAVRYVTTDERYARIFETTRKTLLAGRRLEPTTKGLEP